MRIRCWQDGAARTILARSIGKSIGQSIFFCQPDRCLFDPKSSHPDRASRAGKSSTIGLKFDQNRAKIGPGSASGRLGAPRHHQNQAKIEKK